MRSLKAAVLSYRRLDILGNRAVAIVEFALVAPMVVFFLAAASDYGLMWWSKGCLSNAVAQGVYYAFRTGPTVTAASVKALVENSSSLKFSATVTNPALCYCPSGIPATLGAAVSCSTATCADPVTAGTFLTPGNYVKITATYTLTGFFAKSGMITNGLQISDTATVRLQ
jgi:hypothetical protein